MRSPPKICCPRERPADASLADLAGDVEVLGLGDQCPGRWPGAVLWRAHFAHYNPSLRARGQRFTFTLQSCSPRVLEHAFRIRVLNPIMSGENYFVRSVWSARTPHLRARAHYRPTQRHRFDHHKRRRRSVHLTLANGMHDVTRRAIRYARRRPASVFPLGLPDGRYEIHLPRIKMNAQHPETQQSKAPPWNSGAC